MNILLPMGGKGVRFLNEGYKLNKLELPVYIGSGLKQDRMIMAALGDIPEITQSKLFCVDTEEIKKNGIEDLIRSCYPNVVFVHDAERKGQLQGCLLAESLIEPHEELFIGVCDSGMEYDVASFNVLRGQYDAIVFSHSGSETLLRNPDAHSWMHTQGDSIVRLSLKKTISNNVHDDQATTGFFWYKSAKVFFDHANEIAGGAQREMYVEEVINHSLTKGLNICFLNVSLKCWGTPLDYEEYQQTYEYWYNFFQEEDLW